MSNNYNLSTTSNSALSTILANPFISAPVLFNMEQQGVGEVALLAPFMDSRKKTSSKINGTVPGSIVSDPGIIGATAQVVTSMGVYKKNTTQRLLISAAGPNGQPMTKTIDFYPVFGSNSSSVPAQNSASSPNLGMVISEGLLSPTTDSASSNPAVFPLLVGPQSAVFSSMDNSAQSDILQTDSISFSNVFDIAKRVVPIIANAGYDIYQELSSNDTQEATHDDLGGFLDILGSVAKVAVPVAGAILSSL